MKDGFEPESINDIEVGVRILFKDPWFTGRFLGTVKYVGPIPDRIGYRLGVELDPNQELPMWYLGNSGTFGGKRYFTCTPGRGFFVSFENVIECYR